MTKTIARLSTPSLREFKALAATALMTLMVCLTWIGSSHAQPMPLNLAYLIDQTRISHPTLLSARLDSRASNEDLAAVRRQRWPTVSAVVEDGTKPTASTSATRLLRVEQNLWDGGRTGARIAESEVIGNASQIRIDLQLQVLGLQAVNAWQSLLSSQARVLVAQETLNKLIAYRGQMQRRVKAEASPTIDLELVQSRTLQTQVELTNAQTSLKTAFVKLEQLSGVQGLAAHVGKLPPMPGLNATSQLPALFEGTDWSAAAREHPAVAKARFEHQAAEHRIRVKQADQWPQLYARVDQPIAGSGGKSSAFVGLRFTPGAGFSSTVEAQALDSKAESLAQGVEAASREVLEAMQNDRDEFFNSRQRIEALTNSVDGSEKVLESYGRQFTAGRKTWQDLLNAVREVAQNRYALAEANAAMLGAMYRLQIRLGQGITTMAENSPQK